MVVSRHKGYRQETRLVDTLQEAGFAAEKIRDQEGRRASTEGGDVSVPILGMDYPIECKHRKVGFEPVYHALDKAKFACIQGHHKSPLMVMRLSDWVEIMKRAESYRAPPVDPSVQVIEFKDAAE
jgi:hypothetical protein